MEILNNFFKITIFLTIIIFPLLIFKKLEKLKFKNNFIIYLLLSFIVTSILFVFIGWWSNFSNKILLSHFGFNFEAMNDIDRYRNVTKENLEKVKGLKRNMLGIGWPLKVIISYIIYCPYLLIAYGISRFYKKKKVLVFS
jgi:hypothetical protein